MNIHSPNNVAVFLPIHSPKDRSRLLPGDASGGGIEQPPETKENALRISWEKAQEVITSEEKQGGYNGFYQRICTKDIYGYSYYWVGYPKKKYCAL